MISINLFYYCKGVNIWKVGKNLVKFLWLKKMFLQSPKRGRYYSCRLDSRKGICKDFFESDALFLADVFKNN